MCFTDMFIGGELGQSRKDCYSGLEMLPWKQCLDASVISLPFSYPPVAFVCQKISTLSPGDSPLIVNLCLGGVFDAGH